MERISLSSLTIACICLMKISLAIFLFPCEQFVWEVKIRIMIFKSKYSSYAYSYKSSNTQNWKGKIQTYAIRGTQTY